MESSLLSPVHSAKFISPARSKSLIERLASLGSPYQADQLKRDLYVDGKVKTNNESAYYTVDLLHHAIYNLLRNNIVHVFILVYGKELFVLSIMKPSDQ